MTPRSLALLAWLVPLVLGCASTAPQDGRAYAFEVDGQTYGIVRTGSETERANDLVLLNGGDRLRARDRDQDGTIDTLLTGSLSLAEANAIYARGIAHAQAAGAYTQREPPRTFTMPDGARTLVVWTVAAGGSDWENRFAVYEGLQDPRVFSDADADGILDDAPAGQAAYVRALTEGQRVGRVEVVEGRYRVRVLQPSGD